jgi:hypothetical protein
MERMEMIGSNANDPAAMIPPSWPTSEQKKLDCWKREQFHELAAFFAPGQREVFLPESVLVG